MSLSPWTNPWAGDRLAAEARGRSHGDVNGICGITDGQFRCDAVLPFDKLRNRKCKYKVQIKCSTALQAGLRALVHTNASYASQTIS